MTGSKYKAPHQRPIFGSTLHVESVERLSSLMACLRTLNVQRATHNVQRFRCSMSAYFKPPNPEISPPDQTKTPKASFL